MTVAYTLIWMLDGVRMALCAGCARVKFYAAWLCGGIHRGQS